MKISALSIKNQINYLYYNKHRWALVTQVKPVSCPHLSLVISGQKGWELRKTITVFQRSSGQWERELEETSRSWLETLAMAISFSFYADVLDSAKWDEFANVISAILGSLIRRFFSCFLSKMAQSDGGAFPSHTAHIFHLLISLMLILN